MRAYILDRYKKVSTLEATNDAPEPIPKADEVIIDCFSAGLNYFDILQIEGKYQDRPPFPFVLGYEVAGRISADSPIPSGSPFKRGDRVFATVQGAFADKVCARVSRIVRLPDCMPFDQGAGLHVTYGTTYEALFGRAELKANEWLLVLAAAGGVGLAALQLATAKGAKVIAVASSETKLDIARRYGGAHFTVNYSNKGWQSEVLKLTGGRGVDVVFDPVGAIADCMKCIAWKGRALVIGFAAGTIEKLPLNLVLLKNVSVVGLYWAPYYEREPERVPVVYNELVELYSSGKVKPTFSKVYAFEDLVPGLQAISNRQTWGKVVLRIKDEPAMLCQAKL